MIKNSNYQDLLKTLAIISMITDHLGLYFFPEYTGMRVLGRYAMPIFTFFAGYNFKNQINLSILFAGSLLHIITTIFVYQSWLQMNILISIFLGQIYLYVFRNHFIDFTKGYLHFIILAILWYWTSNIMDYGTLVLSLMVIGHMIKIGSINGALGAFIVAFISILHTFVNFYGFMDNRDLIFSVFVAIFIYLSLYRTDFNRNVAVYYRIIGRNSLFIYFVHVVIIQVTWRYFLVS